jgi:hypothetical protein
LIRRKYRPLKEARGKDWILFGDEGDYKNRYPEYLLDLYRRSAKNHAIINSKKDYVVGQGWAVKEEGMNTLGLAKLQEFINHPNQYESTQRHLREGCAGLRTLQRLCS